MTREEAIRIIETVFQDEYVYKYYDSITHQALDMAIEALKQVTGKLKKPDDSLFTADPEACKEQKSKLDLISRQDAIDALGEEPPVPSADRPRGRWHYSDGKPATIGQSFGVICDQCGTESEYCTNFCGECGADMQGDTERY